MLDPKLLAALPFALRVEISENMTRKDLTQSELAKFQRVAIAHLSAARKQNQGRRTDLRTSTQVAVEVGKPKRFENTTQQVARLFGESEHTARKRLAVVAAAEAEPEKFGKLQADMDRSGSVNGVYRRLLNRQQAEKIRAEPPPLPRGPFRVISADVPLPYEEDAQDPSGRGVHPYPTMSIADICALPVRDLAADDATLWFFINNHHLLAGSHVPILKAWDFNAVTMLTWSKNRFGYGHWLREQTEHCIMAVRGNPTTTLTNQSTWLDAPMGAHSEKPDSFYAMVESLCPAPGYLELFARKARPGWTTWGAEAPQEPAQDTQIGPLDIPAFLKRE